MKPESTIIPQVPKNSPEPDILPTSPVYPRSDGPLNAELLAWQREPAHPTRDDHAFTQQISLQQIEQSPSSTIERTAEYRFTQPDGKPSIHGGYDGHLLSLDHPALLQPVTVAKPWGREVWFTAMESRGESSVVAEHASLPLSNYLALAPDRLCRRRPIVLLKILDPNPQPGLGDLYLEVHEQKREVYVVTSVDAKTWPDGRGQVRIGINQRRRADFANDEAFRAAYLQAVKAYENVRRTLDAGTAIEPSLEAEKRRAMETFTSIREVAVGDVIVVPTWVPHSLQHGVRVVEFQTPTYERFIISFAQRVLTQNHWDSDHAIAHLTLETPQQPALTEVAPGITQIVEFDDFSAWRIELAPGATCQPPLSLPYAVCMNVSGAVTVNGQTLSPEQACFVPHTALPATLRNPSAQTSISLIAACAW